MREWRGRKRKREEEEGGGGRKDEEREKERGRMKAGEMEGGIKKEGNRRGKRQRYNCLTTHCAPRYSNYIPRCKMKD